MQPHAPPPPAPFARQSLDVPWAEAAPAAQAAAGGQQGGATAAAGLPSEQQLLDVYASLAQQGFQQEHIEAALSALPLPALSLETALDWLLLHLEGAQLPKRYAAQARAAGGSVDVKHVAQTPSADQAAAEQQAQQDAAVAAAAAAAAQAELDAQRAAAAERAAAEAAAAEAARAQEEEQRRAWIMQYMQESSDSESESEGGSSRVDSEVRPAACHGGTECALAYMRQSAVGRIVHRGLGAACLAQLGLTCVLPFFTPSTCQSAVGRIVH